jgi:hypothetical protein
MLFFFLFSHSVINLLQIKVLIAKVYQVTTNNIIVSIDTRVPRALQSLEIINI